MTSIFPLQVVKEFYSTQLQAREYMEMSCDFDDECISLAIPRGGITLRSGWKIIPLHSPVVSCTSMYILRSGYSCSLLLDCLYLNRLGKQMLTTLDMVGKFQSVSCSFDGHTETNLMSALSMTLRLLEQKVAHTSHSTSQMKVRDIKWYEQ